MGRSQQHHFFMRLKWAFGVSPHSGRLLAEVFSVISHIGEGRGGGEKSALMPQVFMNGEGGGKNKPE